MVILALAVCALVAAALAGYLAGYREGERDGYSSGYTDASLEQRRVLISVDTRGPSDMFESIVQDLAHPQFPERTHR